MTTSLALREHVFEHGDTALDLLRTALLEDGVLGAWLVCLVSKEPL